MINLNKMTHGTIDFKSKTAEMSSNQTDKIVSPYDGVVIKTHSYNCAGGYLVIKHLIDNVEYYTQFCGISNPLIPLGNKVRGGETIGFFSDKPITFSVLTPNLQYLDPKKFINGEYFDTNKKSKNPTVFNKKSKTPTVINKEKDNFDDPIKSDEYDINVLSPITIPLEYGYRQIAKGTKKLGKELKTIGKDMFKLKDKKKDERLKKAREDKDNENDNQSLNENIQRIKKLLK